MAVVWDTPDGREIETAQHMVYAGHPIGQMALEAFRTSGRTAPKTMWSLHSFHHPRPQLWCDKCGAGPMWDGRAVADAIGRRRRQVTIGTAPR